MTGPRSFVSRLDFIGTRRYWFLLSAILVGISLLALGGRGLNLGIDFTGGTSFAFTFDRPVTTGEVRAVLEGFDLGTSSVRVNLGDPREVFVKTRFLAPGEEDAVRRALEERVSPITDASTERVSALIGRELVLNALWAVALASVGIVAYLSYRFDFRFGVAAIVALIHDALVSMGLVSLIGIEVSAPFVAAILTIIGYSVNDTVIIFDRIRENLKHRRKESFAEVANRSVIETLPRSINTAVTTLLAVGAIYAFGGRTTQDFALTLLIGITLGAYSSIFVAGPLWVAWRERAERARRGPLQPAAR